MAGEEKAEVDGAVRTLRDGAEILAGVLQPHGFRFLFRDSGRSSGGDYANGSFVRDNRMLDVSVRHSLGLVSYYVSGHQLDHESYMKQLGVFGTNSYPSFSPDILEQFRCLASDLLRYCQDFVSGSAAQFVELARDLKDNPSKYKGLPK